MILKSSFQRMFVLSLVVAVVFSLFQAPAARADDSPLPASPSWSADGAQANSGFGVVNRAGDVNGDGYADVIVGATQEGKTYAFYGSADGLSPTPDWMVASDQAGALFGEAVSTAGDVNGDGFDDVIIGARYYHAGQSYEGRAFVYYGSAAGLSTTPNWTAEGNTTYVEFGSSVGTAGDINGDGYDDVLIGAQYYASHGRAYVYFGSPTGLSAAPDWTAEGTRWGGIFGGPSSTAGDVNGDGYDDIILGEPINDYGQVLFGRAYAYYGSASGLNSSADWMVESDQAGSNFGTVGAAGDVNGDGYADVLVAAPRYNNGQANEGRVYLYYGSASGLETTAAWTAESDQVEAYLGTPGVSTAGDINGDGYDDVIIGSYAYDNGETDEGSAFVYLGSASGLSAAPDWSAESNQADATLGFAHTAGDVNGDGNADVIVGATGYDNSYTNQGRVFAYYGSASGARLVVTVSPSADIYPGDLVTVSLDIENADELYGAQAVCQADPEVVALQEAVFGDFFDPINHLIGANYWEAETGIWTGAISQRSPALPRSGDGTFVTITYVAQAAGTTSVNCEPLFADQNGFAQSVTVTPIEIDVTVMPFAVVSGNAQDQGRTEHLGITVTATSAEVGLEPVSAATDSAGNYALQLRTGNGYVIVADASGYLAEHVDTLDVSSGDTVTLSDITLKGGDANNDNSIDIGDATLVAANFGLTVPEADVRADINGDEIVNVQDLAILGGNYGLSGYQP